MTDSKKSERPVLEVELRKILGRKVKALRKQGTLPTNVYGKKIKSTAVQSERTKVEKVFAQVGETGLVNLQIKGEKETRPVLLNNPQVDPLTDQLIHLDFYQVDLTQKVTADIPVETSGEAPAAAREEGVLVQLIQELEVEALPTDLPEKLVVDLSSLDKVDAAISVGQALKASGWNLKKIKVKVNSEQLLVKVEPPTKEEEKPAEAVPVEGEEGQPPAEKTEEGKTAETEKQEEKSEAVPEEKPKN